MVWEKYYKLALHDSSKCPCGSGRDPWRLYDAKDKFVSFVCEDCENKVKAKYRPDIEPE